VLWYPTLSAEKSGKDGARKSTAKAKILYAQKQRRAEGGAPKIGANTSGQRAGLAPDEFGAEEQQRGGQDNAIDREEDQAVFAHPIQEPLHHAQGHDERDHGSDDEHDPVL